MTCRADSRRPAGFTLLEVVLAMTALGMVTAIVYGAFHLGMRSVEKGQVAMVSAQRLRAASDVIRRQIKSMMPYPCLSDEAEPQPYFEVASDGSSIAFITTAGLHGGGGLEHVRYEVRGDPPQLVLSASPVFWFRKRKCGELETRNTTEAVLLDGFRTIAFEPRTYEKGEDWREEGGVAGVGLPRSVHIKVDGLPGSSRAVLGGGEVPIVANLGSDRDGYRVFEQLFEGGAETAVPGEPAADVNDGEGKGASVDEPEDRPGAADEAEDEGEDDGE